MLGVISARTAIRLSFAIVAFSVGLWVFRLGDFKEMQGLTNTGLAFLLLISPVAMTLTLTQSPRLSRWFGLVNLTRFGTALSALAILAISSNPPTFIVVCALITFGASAAIFEVGLNTIAQKIDRESGAIMSSCHGFWSLGFALGGFVAGVLSEYGISFFYQQLMLVPFVLLATLWVSKNLPHPKASRVEDGGNSWPSLQILPLCLLPFASLFIEGAVADWNTIFLSSERGWRDVHIGIAFGIFMVAMAFARFIGDYLREKLSAKSLIQISTGLSIVGLILYACSQVPALIMLGCFLGGLGAGNVYPLAIVIANEGKDESESSKINGSIALISFNAFLIAPVFMGWMSDVFSLSAAFLMILPFFLCTFLWMKLARI